MSVSGSNQPARKGNIILRNLTAEQKKNLMLGQVGLAGIAIGASAFALMGFATNSDGAAPERPEQTGEAIVIATQAPFASGTTDGMDFKQAFDAAREEVGPGGFFEYRGNLYNTFTQKEWEEMSPEGQQQYWASIDQHVTSMTDVEPGQASELSIDSPLQEAAYTNSQQSAGEPSANEVILEVDYFGELDLNKDGIADVLVVDANGNELPDLVFDDDFDGVADRIVMDVDTDAGITGQEESYGLAGVELKVNREDETGDAAESEPEVFEVEYIDAFDTDGDGKNEVIMVDADGNDMPDLLIDRDGDGRSDVVVFDVDLDAGYTGKEEVYGLEGVVLNVVASKDPANAVTTDDNQPDALNDVELNPGTGTDTSGTDAPNFDNDYDVSNYS